MKEKPRMTSFPSEDIISAPYGANVTVKCRATGVPRPTVRLVINGVNMYTSTGGRAVMAPYEAILTYVVKMSSDVECHVSNRLGSSFSRMRINLKGISFVLSQWFVTDCTCMSHPLYFTISNLPSGYFYKLVNEQNVSEIHLWFIKTKKMLLSISIS